MHFVGRSLLEHNANMQLTPIRYSFVDRVPKTKCIHRDKIESQGRKKNAARPGLEPRVSRNHVGTDETFSFRSLPEHGPILATKYHRGRKRTRSIWNRACTLPLSFDRLQLQLQDNILMNVFVYSMDQNVNLFVKKHTFFFVLPF